MDVIHPRCAGVDISKRDAKVAVRVPGSGRKRAQFEVRTFGSTTGQVLALRDWLVGEQVTCVVMEATGDYWKQFYYLLEDGGFEVLLANPRQVRGMPGRKSDVIDAQWLAELGSLGLVKGSFVPPPLVRQLRDLTRLRTQVGRERAREVQRLGKVLEDAGIKLGSVATDLSGVSARAMMRALGDGLAVDDIVELARRPMRAKRAELADALVGRFTAHHAYQVRLLLGRVDAQDKDMVDLTRQIDALMVPYEHAHDLLVTIPGVSDLVADVIIAETGGDMSQFPTAKHLASWAGVAPGCDQSGPRAKSARTRPGNTHLRGALGIVALAATKTSKTYFSAQYRRITSRRGPVRALVAVENSVVTAVWHMLTNATVYTDPGPVNAGRILTPFRRLNLDPPAWWLCGST
ncbi:MAG: IS110 family transposase [Micrococcales bacterium]|nr:IS110 family transposase [Micrococcales bacterium]MCL2667812.1 IS110 family transposase [Micrococcales bacterium]